MTDHKKQLYIILSDYSDDLGALKKRDGRFPADAAVERILVLTKPSQADHNSEWLHKMIWDVFESVPSRDETQPTKGVMERFVPALSQAIQAELSKAEKRGELKGLQNQMKHKIKHQYLLNGDKQYRTLEWINPLTVLSRIKQLEADLSIGGEK